VETLFYALDVSIVEVEEVKPGIVLKYRSFSIWRMSPDE
jgi:hypothetical protein